MYRRPPGTRRDALSAQLAQSRGWCSVAAIAAIGQAVSRSPLQIKELAISGADRPDLFALVRDLRAAPPVWPAVTIVVGADPTDPDRARLRVRAQADAARTQLETAGGTGEREIRNRVARLVDRVSTVTDDAVEGLRHGSAVVVCIGDGPDGEELDRVIEVADVATDRAIVASRFALSDVIRAANRAAHYRVLVLSERPARLLEGTGETLTEIEAYGFPHSESSQGGRGTRVHRLRTSHSTHRDAARDEWLRRVDRMLSEAQRDEALPVVLVAVRAHADAFARVSDNRGDVIAHVEGSHANENPAALAGLVWPAAQAAFDARRLEALGRLDAARGANRDINGPDELLAAATAGRLALAVLDNDAAIPAVELVSGLVEIVEEDDARLAANPDDNNEVVAVFDDLLDEIAARAIETGGEVRFVESDVLGADGPAAGVLRW